MAIWAAQPSGAQIDQASIGHGDEGADIQLAATSSPRGLRIDALIAQNSDVIDHVLQIKLNGLAFVDIVVPAGAGVGGVPAVEFFKATAASLALDTIVLQSGSRIYIRNDEVIGSAATINVTSLSAVL